ncbi:hypothetical protein [Lysobacter antibioticus]|uniref:hypothetical protein n=1 Tax=Lysobacter antibioticus TaxID=84531 RepID=UPI00071673EB|nr:hypothetical protein [Lysobacter antibioticus]
MRKFNQIVATLLLFAVVGVAAAVTLRGSTYQLPAVNGVTVRSDIEIRVAAISAMTAAYRVTNGLSSLPVGTIVTVVYQDGSSEKAEVVSVLSSIQATPIPGTQQLASTGGGGSGGTGGEGGSGGSGGSWGGVGGGDCYGECTGKVIVGAETPANP